MTDVLLAARGLACRRGDRLLWSGLNISLSAGGAVHVTGANGIGKSSLLRLLCGLLPAAHGEIERTGATAFLDEHPAIDADLPLNRALSFWASVDATAAEQVTQAIDNVGLAAIAGLPLRLFSTGQQKRAAIARLLVQQAPVWLLDEPLNGLDSDGADRLISIIDAHRRGGGGAIIASHQPLPLTDVAVIALSDHVA